MWILFLIISISAWEKFTVDQGGTKKSHNYKESGYAHVTMTGAPRRAGHYLRFHMESINISHAWFTPLTFSEIANSKNTFKMAQFEALV